MVECIERRIRTTPLPPIDTLDIPAWEYENRLPHIFPSERTKSLKERQIEAHRRRTESQVLADLASGALFAMGRPKADGKFGDPVRIDPRFWLDARFYFGFGAAGDDHILFDRLRVAPANSADVTMITQSAFSNTASDTARQARTRSRIVRGGRGNMSGRIKRKAIELWKNDASFRRLKNRTEQAREVKARELGEDARNADDMPECKLSSAKRWVGEALKPLVSGKPA